MRIEGVSKTYPNGKAALIDVDLVIPEGDFIFLVGPSGAGKSTLIKLLVRDEKATPGPRRGRGLRPGRMRRSEDVPLLRRTHRHRLPGLPPAAAQDRLRERRVRARGDRHAALASSAPSVDRVLALVGLTGQARQRPDQLSGGELQRTAIARAMVHDPRLIIADEPTGNLDPLISWEIIQLLLRINELGTTVLMATHDAEVVTALRRRVVALEDGRIVRDEVGGYHREY